MLGEKLKELREAKGLLQRQVAAELDVDTAYISKMENNDKPVSRNNLVKLARLFDINEEQLFTYWLADKVFDILKDEKMGLRAISIAEEELKTKNRNK
jgi:HTH-type transcriptional regulator, competence development regulator